MGRDRDWDNAFTGSELTGKVEHAPSFAGAQSFLRRRFSRDLDGVDVAVVGVPLDTATSNRPGARFGPRALRMASSSMTWARPWPWDVDPLEALAVIDYGDCPFDSGVPADVPGEITAFIEPVVAAGVTTLVLGGDHFISYPVLAAHARHHGPLSLIHFDAHSDTWPDRGERIDHGTMFFHAVNKGYVDDAHSVQIGLRTTNDDPMGFQVLDAQFVHQQGSAAVIDRVRAVVGERPAYLTFDIDCLDPAFAPGTGTPVCGGLSSHQALEIVRGLSGLHFVGADVVEVAPAYDVGDITAFAGATLATEFLCLFATDPTRAPREVSG